MFFCNNTFLINHVIVLSYIPKKGKENKIKENEKDFNLLYSLSNFNEHLEFNNKEKEKENDNYIYNYYKCR